MGWLATHITNKIYVPRLHDILRQQEYQILLLHNDMVCVLIASGLHAIICSVGCYNII